MRMKELLLGCESARRDIRLSFYEENLQLFGVLQNPGFKQNGAEGSPDDATDRESIEAERRGFQWGYLFIAGWFLLGKIFLKLG